MDGREYERDDRDTQVYYRFGQEPTSGAAAYGDDASPAHQVSGELPQWGEPEPPSGSFPAPQGHHRPVPGGYVAPPAGYVAPQWGDPDPGPGGVHAAPRLADAPWESLPQASDAADPPARVPPVRGATSEQPTYSPPMYPYGPGGAEPAARRSYAQPEPTTFGEPEFGGPEFGGPEFGGPVPAQPEPTTFGGPEFGGPEFGGQVPAQPEPSYTAAGYPRSSDPYAEHTAAEVSGQHGLLGERGTGELGIAAGGGSGQSPRAAVVLRSDRASRLPARRESGDEDEFGRARVFRRRRSMPLWQELPLLLVVAFCLAVLIRTFLLQAFYIPSSSMERTLLVGDRVLVNKIVYDIRQPDRGEVIVFSGPANWAPENPQVTGGGPFARAGRTLGDLVGVSRPGEKDFIKRVIGVPGDRVSCCDPAGRIYVNGKGIDEPYINVNSAIDVEPNPRTCSSRRFDEVLVPPGQLFVMGDNRIVSQDSRCQGTVPVENVIGRAFAIVWPSARWESLSVPESFDSVPPPVAASVADPTAREPARPGPTSPDRRGVAGAVVGVPILVSLAACARMGRGRSNYGRSGNGRSDLGRSGGE